MCLGFSLKITARGSPLDPLLVVLQFTLRKKINPECSPSPQTRGCDWSFHVHVHVVIGQKTANKCLNTTPDQSDNRPMREHFLVKKNEDAI